MKPPFLSAIAALLAISAATAQEMSPSADGTRLYFITPMDGDTVSNPVTVRFGLEGMGVAPAGMEQADTGHHHLIIDAALPEMGEPVPADDNHHHFGGGQTQTTIELPSGEHSLQLLLGDHNHIPHDPPVTSERISITVE